MQKENVNLHAEENEDWGSFYSRASRKKLPAGWKWTMYSDGSGRLKARINRVCIRMIA